MKPSQPPPWRVVGRVFGAMLWERRRTVAAAYLFRALSVALSLLAPWPLKLIIDHVLTRHALPRPLRSMGLDSRLSPEAMLLVLAAAIIIIATLRAFTESRQAVITARLRERLNAALRDRMLAHLQTLPPTIRTVHRSGELVLRLVNDVDLFVRFQARTLPMIVEHIVTTVATVAMMFWIEPRIALLSLALLPGVAMLVRYHGRRLGAASRERRRREGDVAGFAQEMVRGLAVIQALGGEAYTRERFRKMNARTLTAGVEETRVAAGMERALRITHGGAMAVLIGAGAVLVLHGQLTVGALTVLASYLTQLLKPVERLNDIAENASKGVAGGERLIALLAQESVVRDAPDAINIQRARGVIELRDVWFDYGTSTRRRPVLRGVNLRLEPGQLAVLVGASGAGKSTLLNLLVRLFDPTQGTILLDGRPITGITLRSLRQQIAVMSQETHLFAGSIREALIPDGSTVSDGRIWEALSFVALEGFVRDLPEGLDAVLGEDGLNLSGGQRQRLSLARAFLLDRPILLLDEPLSHVDAASEAVVAEALGQMRAKRTCLAITHRLSLFDNADVIYRLEDGRIVDQSRWRRIVPSGVRV
jgi:ABC-type multidrug transport system fused ATPase/permease subunit